MGRTRGSCWDEVVEGTTPPCESCGTWDRIESRAALTRYICRYKEALLKQPTLAIFGTLPYQALAAWSFAVGSVLVVSSMWALGVTGTYLGDYFVSPVPPANT